MNTNIKGTIATGKVLADVLARGWQPFIPVGEYNLRYDMLVVTEANIVYKLQIKYCTSGKLNKETVGYNNIIRPYNDGDFDFYAAYFPEVDKVLYPAFKFKGAKIATTPRKTAAPFYWYEDFLGLTETAKRRTYKDFGIVLSKSTEQRIAQRKVTDRPSPEVLQDLLWTLPTTKIGKHYGVSDNAVARWAKEYNLEKPPRGYWMKRKELGDVIRIAGAVACL